MAQRMESVKDHLRTALATGTTRAQHGANANRTARTNSIDAGNHFKGRKHKFSFDSYPPSITCTKRSKQRFECNMQAWVTKQWHSAWNLSKITAVQP
jgi:hypothetical protein